MVRRAYAANADYQYTTVTKELVCLLIASGDLAAARAVLPEAVTRIAAQGMLSAISSMATAIAALLADAGNLRDAARLAGFYMRVQPYVRQRVGAIRRLLDRVDGLLAALPADERATLAAEGAGWSDEQATTTIVALMRGLAGPAEAASTTRIISKN
jgi:hypothetical protein